MYRVLVDYCSFAALPLQRMIQSPNRSPNPSQLLNHLDITLSINDEIVFLSSSHSQRGNTIRHLYQDLDIEMVPTLPKRPSSLAG